MVQVDVSAGGRIERAIPRPVSVQVDQMTVRGDDSKKQASIYFIDFASVPMEYLGLEPAHFEFAGSKVQVVHRGDTLYRAREDCRNFFVVRTGSFKSVMLHGRGLTQVTGFRIAGEVLGLGGLSDGRYDSDAIALEDSTVCAVPLDALENACHARVIMLRHVHRILSGEIARNANLMLLLGTMNTEKRIATFLVDFSTRLQCRGYSATEFRLRMKRADICSFLGITRRTLQRAFSQLSEKRLVVVHGEDVHILNRVALASL